MVCESGQLTGAIYFLIWKTSSNKWFIHGNNDIATTKDSVLFVLEISLDHYEYGAG